VTPCPLLKIACLHRVDSGSFGKRLKIFGQNENSKSSFCAHETQYLQNKLSKSQPPQQQQCRKMEREIKSP
jgi:hypothetical protein